MENLVTGIVDALKSDKSDIESYRDELDEIFSNLYFNGIGADNGEETKTRHLQGSWIFLVTLVIFRWSEGIEPADQLYTDVLDEKG